VQIAQSIFADGARLFRARNITGAIDRFDEAESVGYEWKECAAYRWECWMLLGEFERAWQESDRISRRGARGPDELWNERPFDNNRVIVRCLHGYGDAIQFLRYAPLIRSKASRLIVQTHPEMVSLVRCMRGVDQVVTWHDAPPRQEWDQQIEVTELPRAFRTTLATIPVDVPYISLNPEAIAQSRNNLRGTGRPRVGLLWASSGWNLARHLKLSELRPLLNLPGLDFYSFQRGEARVEIAQVAEAVSIHDTSGHSPEIVHTAADLVNMDLLITADTMAAHLAGALGRPVWVLLPFEADWRWMLERSDSPWYPTMRLFRQTKPGDWSAPVAEMTEALSNYVHAVPSLTTATILH
jgi:hypothetical protein